MTHFKIINTSLVGSLLQGNEKLPIFNAIELKNTKVGFLMGANTGDQLTWSGSEWIPVAGAGVNSLPIATNDSSALVWQTDQWIATESNVRLGSGSGIGQGTPSVAIGFNAGIGTSFGSVAIGLRAGNLGQLFSSVAIGENCGKENQSSKSVGIGRDAGNTNQGTSSIAIGDQTGYTGQGDSSIAFGEFAARNNQGENSIAIGSEAGNSDQGDNCIAIGQLAGETSQHSNSIVLNASGLTLDTGNTGACYINPIRNITSTHNLLYNPTTSEITYQISSANIQGTILTYPTNTINGYITENLVDKRVHISFKLTKNLNGVIAAGLSQDIAYNNEIAISSPCTEDVDSISGFVSNSEGIFGYVSIDAGKNIRIHNPSTSSVMNNGIQYNVQLTYRTV
jgi:hypothetical protein